MIKAGGGNLEVIDLFKAEIAEIIPNVKNEIASPEPAPRNEILR